MTFCYAHKPKALKFVILTSPVYCMSLGIFFVLTACSLTEIHYPKRD